MKKNIQAKAHANAAPLKAALLQQAPLYRQAVWQSFVIGLLLLAPSWFMFEVYGRVLDSRNLSTLFWLIMMVAGVYVVLELLEIARSRALFRAAQQADEALRTRVFNTAFEANLRKIPGGTVQVFVDLRTVRDFVASPAVTAALDIPAALVCLGLLFAISAWLGVMAMIGACLQVGLAYITDKRTMPLLQEATMASIDGQNYASGALRNAQVIQSMGMMGKLQQRWMQRQKRFLSRQASASDTAGFTTMAAKLVQTTQSSLLLGAAAWLALNNGLLGGGGMIIVA